MEKMTIKDLVQKALENMMPTVDQLNCDVNQAVTPGVVVLGTAGDNAKILYALRNQKGAECEILCKKSRNPEEEETHFDLHIIAEVLNDLFWREISFQAGLKNNDSFSSYGIRDEWKVVGLNEGGATLPAAGETVNVSLLSLLIKEVSEKMQNIPGTIEAGGELQEDQTDLGEMTDYEKALALVHFAATHDHNLLAEKAPDDLFPLFERMALVEVSSLLFKNEIRLRLGLKAKQFSDLSFLDNWHVAGGEASEEEVMMAMIGSSPLGMAIAMAAMSRVFDED